MDGDRLSQSGEGSLQGKLRVRERSPENAGSKFCWCADSATRRLESSRRAVRPRVRARAFNPLSSQQPSTKVAFTITISPLMQVPDRDVTL